MVSTIPAPTMRTQYRVRVRRLDFSCSVANRIRRPRLVDPLVEYTPGSGPPANYLLNPMEFPPLVCGWTGGSVARDIRRSM